MKIDKDKFNKLKQLDRIEFRQKLKWIEGIRFSIIDTLWYVLIFAGIFMIGSETAIKNEVALMFSQVVGLFLLVTFFLILIHIVIGLAYYFVRVKKEEELFKEYFKVETKK